MQDSKYKVWFFTQVTSGCMGGPMISSTTLIVDPNGNGNCFTFWRTKCERENTLNPIPSSSFSLSCIVPSSCSKLPVNPVSHLERPTYLTTTLHDTITTNPIFTWIRRRNRFLILASPLDGLLQWGRVKRDSSRSAEREEQVDMTGGCLHHQENK